MTIDEMNELAVYRAKIKFTCEFIDRLRAAGNQEINLRIIKALLEA